jgi:hypothetical protein
VLNAKQPIVHGLQKLAAFHDEGLQRLIDIHILVLAVVLA